MSRLIRHLRDAWVIAGLTLLLVLVVDAALREWLPESSLIQVSPGASMPDRKTAPAYADVDWAAAYWTEHRAAKDLVWAPYVYWRRKAHAGELINVDRRGIRRTQAAPGVPSATLWILGGSAVWGTGVRDQDTLASWLARLLAEQGVVASVLNLGESGYVTGQTLAGLRQRLGELPAPDLLLFLEGANDVFAALQSGVPGTPQNEGNRARDFGATDGIEGYLKAFPRALEGVRRLGRAQPAPPVAALAPGIVTVFQRNRALAEAIGSVHGARALHVWQPTVFSRPRPDAHERSVIDASLVAHVELQRAVDALMSSDPGPVVVLPVGWSESVPSAFIDFVHPGPGGTRALAVTLLPHVLEKLKRPEAGRPAAE